MWQELEIYTVSEMRESLFNPGRKCFDWEILFKSLVFKIHVLKYLAKHITLEELEKVLKDSLSKEDVEEKYVRDFLSCSIIDRNSSSIKMDKIMFIYKYGSKKAKKIAVDEKLKMI